MLAIRLEKVGKPIPVHSISEEAYAQRILDIMKLVRESRQSTLVP